MKTKVMYQVHEFAERAGVTIRTLHHYDRLGLLKPSGYTKSGYRLYTEDDLVRLQQIVTLKFIGCTLKDIKELLNQNRFNLAAMLRLQREIIEDKRRHLELAISAIDKAERVVASSSDFDWEVFKKIIEVINMQNNSEWMKKYYTQEQLDELAKRGTPEVLQKGQEDWAALIKDVEASLNEDPASEKAQALAERWENLIKAFTMGDPGIEKSLKNLYSDQANWPTTFKKPYSDEVEAFICKAIAIRKGKS